MKNSVGRNERMYQKSRRKEALVIVGYLLCIALILGGIIYLVSELTKQDDDADPADIETVAYKGEEYVPKNNLESILFIGYDDYSDSGDRMTDFDQSDFLFLVVIDKAKSKYTTIHIDRDTIAKFWRLNGDGKKLGDSPVEEQIALSYACVGADVKTCSSNTWNAVNELLNRGDVFDGRHKMRITHYVTFGMDSIGALNNAVGGVEVEVPYDIGDLKKTDEGKKIKLTDEQALTFVRARQTTEEPTNEARMVRQRSFIDAFIKQFGDKAANDENFVKNVIENDLAEKIVSDNITRVAELASEAVKLNTYEYRTLEGERTSDGEYIRFIPDEGKLTELVLDVFYSKKAK